VGSPEFLGAASRYPRAIAVDPTGLDDADLREAEEDWGR
jgi:hypothetical protein